MSERDDQSWLEALAGRSDAAAQNSEGARLRRAIRARRGEPIDAVASQDAVREAALIARARSEGLIDRGHSPRMSGAAREWFMGWRGAVAMAALATVAVWIGFAMNGPRLVEDDVEIVRGTGDDTVVIEAAEPLILRTRLVDALRDVGIDAVGYETPAHQGIDALLPDPLPPEVAAVLARFGIDAPPGSELRIVVVANAP